MTNSRKKPSSNNKGRKPPPPVVKGGQGRSSEEVYSLGKVSFLIVSWFVFLGLIVLIFKLAIDMFGGQP